MNNKKPFCGACGYYCTSCGICRRRRGPKEADGYTFSSQEYGDIACIHFFPRADKWKLHGQNLCGEIKRAGNRKEGLLRVKARLEEDLKEVEKLLEKEDGKQ